MFAALSTPSYPIAFVAGVVSFLSPCVFPLMPAYAAYVGGGVDSASNAERFLVGMTTLTCGIQFPKFPV